MTPRQSLDAWLAVLNRSDRQVRLLAPDLVVVYLPRGKGGPSVRLVGVAEVLAWAWRGPDGRYAYSATEPLLCPPSPDLPPADVASAARYAVTSLEATWTNGGDWTIHTVEDRIVGVLHAPDTLPDDCAITL